jgi:probable F420-dependent oxidoreductase
VRFSVQLPTERVDRPGEFLSAAAVGEMARAAEQAGFDACFVTDHPMPGDRWLAAGGHHSLDPFVALSFAAAATSRLRLHTHVLVLPYRNPFLVAKAAASLDVLSGGRLILGVATGYLESEFAALGVPFAERNELTDEALDALVRAWSEEGVAFEGGRFRAEGNTALPRPLQRPRPPIWVGGNSRRAIRRAVERGDGWLPFPAPPRLAGHIRTAALESVADLEKGLAYAREHAAQVGRAAPLDVCFVPFGYELYARREVEPERFRVEVARLAALGVTWLAFNVSADSRADYLARVETLGRDVVVPCRALGSGP